MYQQHHHPTHLLNGPTTDQTKAPTTRKPTRPPRTPRPTKNPTPIPTPNTPQLNQNGLVIAVDDTISLQSGTTEAFIAVLENDTGSNLIVRAITAQPTNGQCSISLNLSEVVYIPNDTSFVGSDQCTYEHVMMKKIVIRQLFGLLLVVVFLLLLRHLLRQVHQLLLHLQVVIWVQL